MTSTCITSLDICGIRVAKLLSSGSPDDGIANGYFSDAPQKLKVTVDTKKGDTKDQINGCGALMATFKDPDLIKGVSLALDLCQLDAELLEILTGASLFTSGANAIGMQLPAVGSEPPNVCLEAWSKAWDGDSQIVDAFTSPNSTYIHWVFPWVQSVQGDFTMEHELMIVPVNSVGKENARITANGPFNDWPSAVAARGGVVRCGGWFYDGTLPTNSCTYVNVTSAAS